MPPEAPTTPPDPNRETRRLLYLALVVAGLVGILHFTPLKAWMDDVRAWKLYVDQFGWRAHVAFIIGSVAAIAVGVPRLLLAVAGGALFGFLEGFVVAMMSGLLGSYMTFLAARRGSSERLRQRLRANESLSHLLARPTVLKIFFVRQLPVPALAPNVMLGLVKAPHRIFLAGTFLGYLPTNAVVVAMGSAMGKDDAKTAMWMVTWGMAGLALVAVLVMWVRRRLASSANGNLSD